MKAEKRRKNEGEKTKNAWKYWNSKRERERELTFKPTTKENLVLFVVPKVYIKNKSIKDELCKK